MGCPWDVQGGGELHQWRGREYVARMATTVVSWAKARGSRTTLYVGGLGESVNVDLLRSAFVPFGDLKDVSLPIDYKTGRHRGFGFVEFELEDDAAEALENMHDAEIDGRTLNVSLAQPPKRGGLKSRDPAW